MCKKTITIFSELVRSKSEKEKLIFKALRLGDLCKGYDNIRLEYTETPVTNDVNGSYKLLEDCSEDVFKFIDKVLNPSDNKGGKRATFNDIGSFLEARVKLDLIIEFDDSEKVDFNFFRLMNESNQE